MQRPGDAGEDEYKGTGEVGEELDASDGSFCYDQQFGTHDPKQEASLMAQVVKNLPANAGDQAAIPGLGRSPRDGNGNPLQYSCPENPMDRSLAGYSPWGCKESDTIEGLNIHTSH